MDWASAIATFASTDTAVSIDTLSIAVACAAAIMLTALVVAAVLTRERWPRFKKPLYTLIVSVTAVATVVLASGVIYRNLNSPMGGPVRWSADYQIWACDNQLNLRGPQSALSNRVGSASLFERNDGRIYYQGTPSKLPDDATLGRFMQAVGGDISGDSLTVPLDSGNGFVGTPSNPEYIAPYIATNAQGSYVRLASGQACGETRAEVQAFVYSYNPTTKTYHQTKLDHPASYELSHTNTDIPDCVIVEFAPTRERTDHLCGSFGQRDYDRCTQFGVPADKVARCDIREVR